MQNSDQFEEQTVTSDACVETTEPELESQLETRTVQAKGMPTEVLILEDDVVQLRLLRMHLESLGLKVIEAATISAAWEALKQHRPQLAILDVSLPDGSGLEFCEQIDEDPTFADMPMIVLSSLPSEDMVRRTRAAGGCYFVGKPYDPNVLLVLIERLLCQPLQ